MIEKIGWEAWTRTRIARSRVWSPTNWTTSQRLKRGDSHHTVTASHGANGRIFATEKNRADRQHKSLFKQSPDFPSRSARRGDALEEAYFAFADETGLCSAAPHTRQFSSWPKCASLPCGRVTQCRTVHGGLWRTCCRCPHSSSATQSRFSSR